MRVQKAVCVEINREIKKLIEDPIKEGVDFEEELYLLYKIEGNRWDYYVTDNKNTKKSLQKRGYKPLFLERDRRMVNKALIYLIVNRKLIKADKLLYDLLDGLTATYPIIINKYV